MKRTAIRGHALQDEGAAYHEHPNYDYIGHTTGDLSEAHTGKDQPLADGPVHVEWDGDGWLWTYVEGTA
jgi:hypothetical protein